MLDAKKFKILQLHEPIPLLDAESRPVPLSRRKSIDVHGRVEHEAILKDHKKCEELGLDIYYENMIYLKRWGGWLNEKV